MTFREFILEANNVDIAQQFCSEFLSNFETNEKGSHNCAWVTQQFIKWAKQKGINAKAIYFVWPEKQDNSGESHIAPIIDNVIIDFTYRQFNRNFNDCAKLTPYNNWMEVYGPYGYGQNTVNVNGEDVTVLVDTFENLERLKEIDGIKTIHPSNKKL